MIYKAQGRCLSFPPSPHPGGDQDPPLHFPALIERHRQNLTICDGAKRKKALLSQESLPIWNPGLIMPGAPWRTQARFLTCTPSSSE